MTESLAKFCSATQIVSGLNICFINNCHIEEKRGIKILLVFVQCSLPPFNRKSINARLICKTTLHNKYLLSAFFIGNLGLTKVTLLSGVLIFIFISRFEKWTQLSCVRYDEEKTQVWHSSWIRTKIRITAYTTNIFSNMFIQGRYFQQNV